MTEGPSNEDDEDSAIIAGVENVESRPRRSKLRRIMGDFVLPIGFLVVLAVFLWSERDRLEPLAEAPGSRIALLVVLVALTHFLNSGEFWLLYRANGSHSGIFENWFLFLAGQLGNTIPGQAGTVYRLRYMRAVHDVSYGRSAAVYAADFVATLAGAAAVLLLGVAGVAIEGDGISWVMLVVALGLAGLAVAFAVMPMPAFASNNRLLARIWRSFHSGFEQIRRDPGTAIMVVLLEVAKYFVYATRLAVAFDILGINESFWLYLVLAGVSGVASFVAITPGAIGFREGFVAAAAAAMGAGLDTGLLAATVDRAVQLVTSMGLGAIGFLVTYPRLRASRSTEEQSLSPSSP